MLLFLCFPLKLFLWNICQAEKQKPPLFLSYEELHVKMEHHHSFCLLFVSGWQPFACLVDVRD